MASARGVVRGIALGLVVLLIPAAARAGGSQTDEGWRSIRSDRPLVSRVEHVSETHKTLEVSPGTELGPAATSGTDLAARAPASGNAWSGQGQIYKEYSIEAYSQSIASNSHPERTVVEWILRRTGQDAWHGEILTTLSATRNAVRVIHRSDVHQQVAEIVDRFNSMAMRQVHLRVRFVTVEDPGWRVTVYPVLKPLASGPQGQQAWLMSPEDSGMVFAALSGRKGSRLLAAPRLTADNGQTAAVDTMTAINYVQSLILNAGAWPGFSPVLGQLSDGVRLRFNPLATLDGQAIDFAFNLEVDTTAKPRDLQVNAPTAAGYGQAKLQVPEATNSNFAQIVRWPVSQVLLLSAGIQPPILQAKGGFLGLPGTGPNPAEVLVFVEVESGTTAGSPPTVGWQTSPFAPIRQ